MFRYRVNTCLTRKCFTWLKNEKEAWTCLLKKFALFLEIIKSCGQSVSKFVVPTLHVETSLTRLYHYDLRCWAFLTMELISVTTAHDSSHDKLWSSSLMVSCFSRNTLHKVKHTHTQPGDILNNKKSPYAAGNYVSHSLFGPTFDYFNYCTSIYWVFGSNFFVNR